MVESQRVARRVEKDRLVADAAVEDLGYELDAVCLQPLPSRGHVVDGARSVRVRTELLPERSRLHDRDRQVARLKLEPGMSPQRLTNGSPSTVA